MLKNMISRIESEMLSVGIVGLGYVGLPLALRFAEVGIKVLGIDVDQSKIDSILNGLTYIKHIPGSAVSNARRRGFVASCDFSLLHDVDVIILCVPTPLGEHREPDLSYVLKTVDSVLPFLRPGNLVSLESTTYPGTTDEVLRSKIESLGYKVGVDVFLVFSPEREDPGNPLFNTQSIPKIIGGCTAECLQVGIKLYGRVVDRVVPMSSARAAELTKLLENIHRAVNIGLVNEMKMVADAMNIDIHEVIRAAATKPFGFVPYYPGPGLGGHCIPIDPFYLTWKAREYGVHTRFIELAGEINSEMPRWVFRKLATALNNQGKPIKGSRILILGIAYKRNIDDMRESPAVELLSMLKAQGAIVNYSDPWVLEFPRMRKYRFDLKSVELDPNVIAQYDAILLTTDHDAFDYNMILANARLLVDTRGVYQVTSENLVKA